MVFIALLIGAVLIVAAVRNSQGALASALVTDLPGYVIWAAAIFAVGAVGWIPGLKPVSRGLLALVIVVIVLNNYNAVLSGFSSAVAASQKQSPSGGTGTPGGATSVASVSSLASSASQAANMASSLTAAGVD